MFLTTFFSCSNVKHELALFATPLKFFNVLNMLVTQLSTTLIGMKIDTVRAHEVERQAVYEDPKHSRTKRSECL